MPLAASGSEPRLIASGAPRLVAQVVIAEPRLQVLLLVADHAVAQRRQISGVNSSGHRCHSMEVPDRMTSRRHRSGCG